MQQQMQQQSKGFFAKLFDFSFRDFITPTIIAILYGIFIVLVGLGVLGLIITGFVSRNLFTGDSTWYIGLIYLILSPIIFLLSVIMVRVYLEVVVALIRIAQNTTDLLRK